MIKAVFFDVDGTLVSFKTHKVPESTLKAIEELQSKGIKVIVATGRHPKILGMGNNIDKINFDGFVTLNGQLCFTKENEVIYERHMDKEDIKAIVNYIEENNIACGFVEPEGMFLNKITAKAKEVFDEVNLPLPKVKEAREAIDTHIFQLNPYISVDDEKDFMKNMPNSTATRWSPLFIDVIPNGGGKHMAISKIIEYYGYDKSEIMAFGDGGNDKSMIEYAGIGVAMGNANPEVKESADYVTTTVDDNGILNALKYFKIL